MTPECESAYKETRFNTRQFKCNIHHTIYLWPRNANLRIIYIYMDWWHWNANPRLKKPDSIPVSLSLIYTVPSICDPGCEPAYTNVAGCYTRQLRIHRTIPLRTWKCHVTEDSFIWNLGTYLQPGSFCLTIVASVPVSSSPITSHLEVLRMWQDCCSLIIDEISFATRVILRTLDRSLRLIRNQPDIKYGGVSVL